ncbi:MAG: ArsC family reductase [Halobacteria archaeon]|nr:ArsC family reductase [Halobacteria archaeon]
MTTLYGIKNCDTIRKARRWLADHDIEYRFHDFRTDGISEGLLAPWVEEIGWEQLLNRRGTTWRKLPEAERNSVNQTSAMNIMLTHPAIIRRPLLDTGKTRHVGFSEEAYSSLLQG